MASSSDHHIYWRIYFLLAVVESAGFLFILINIPSEGVSIARFFLLGILVLAFLSSLWAFFNIPRISSLINSRIFPKLINASALLALTLAFGLFLLRYLNPARLLVYYERAAPLLFFLLFFSIQSIILFSYLHLGFYFENIKKYKYLIVPFLFSFIFLIGIFLFITITKLGLTPDPAYWGEPGVPIFFWQLAIILLISSFIFFYKSRITKHEARFSYTIPLSIYLITVILWLSVPTTVLKTSFYVSIDPPTFQPFPYSDAGYYDWMAHSLLIGYPYQGDIPTRPLFIVFLAFLHFLLGENYKLIMMGQTLLLAFIPVIFYFIGKQVHSRAAGVTVALLAIFREFNSILISSQTRVSNSKTLLVDLPTLLLLSLVCLFVLRWLVIARSKETKQSIIVRSALLAGGSFGLLLLLRTQSMLLLPFIFLIVFLHSYFRSKSKIENRPLIPNSSYLISSFFFLLSLILTIAPWLTHNYLQTGKFSFDAPFQYKIIASQYAYTGNLDLQNINLEGKGIGGILLEFALKDPKFVFGFIANHFLAAQVDGLLALPLIKPYNGIFEPINLYWTSWKGSIEWYNALLLIFYLALIALGLAAAWKRLGWAGLTPLFFNIGYALATAIGRFSGWRYDLPADWVPYFYFSIGSVEGFGIIISLFKESRHCEEGVLPNEAISLPRGGLLRTNVLAMTLFIFLGALPWMAKGTVAPRYPDQTIQTLSSQITSMSNAPQLSEIESFTEQPEAFYQIGRVLYPRFYIRNDGASSARPWPAYETRDYPRMGFLFLNQALNHAVFPTRDNETQIPQAADAIILGCKHADYVEVRLIALPQTDKIYTTTPLNEPCAP